MKQKDGEPIYQGIDQSKLVPFVNGGVAGSHYKNRSFRIQSSGVGSKINDQ
jgi:hypothetical protein